MKIVGKSGFHYYVVIARSLREVELVLHICCLENVLGEGVEHDFLRVKYDMNSLLT